MRRLIKSAFAWGLMSFVLHANANLRLVVINDHGEIISNSSQQAPPFRVYDVVISSSHAWWFMDVTKDTKYQYDGLVFRLFNGQSWSAGTELPYTPYYKQYDQVYSACGSEDSTRLCKPGKGGEDNLVVTAFGMKDNEYTELFAVMHGGKIGPWFTGSMHLFDNGYGYLDSTCGGGKCFILHSQNAQNQNKVSISPVQFDALSQDPLGGKVALKNQEGQQYTDVLQSQTFWSYFPNPMDPYHIPVFYHDSAGNFYGMFYIWPKAGCVGEKNACDFDLNKLKLSPSGRVTAQYLQQFHSLMTAEIVNGIREEVYDRYLVRFWHGSRSLFVLTTEKFDSVHPSEAEQTLHYSMNNGKTWKAVKCKGTCLIFPSKNDEFFASFAQDRKLVAFDPDHPNLGVMVFDPKHQPQFFTLPKLSDQWQIVTLKTAPNSDGNYWAVAKKNTTDDEAVYQVYHFDYAKQIWRKVGPQNSLIIRLEAMPSDRAIMLFNRLIIAPGSYPQYSSFFQYFNGSALSGQNPMPEGGRCYTFEGVPQYHITGSDFVFGSGFSGSLFLRDSADCDRSPLKH